MVRRSSKTAGATLPGFEDNSQAEIEFERRKRICVSLWAWAYEKHSASIVSDSHFDKTCLSIDTSVKTGNKRLDAFFESEFHPDTGQWVHKHPEKPKLEKLYQRLVKSGAI
jgi:hypothetical protein